MNCKRIVKGIVTAVVRSLGRHYDEKAIEAVRQRRFEPGKKDGVAVPMPYDVEF